MNLYDAPFKKILAAGVQRYYQVERNGGLAEGEVSLEWLSNVVSYGKSRTDSCLLSQEIGTSIQVKNRIFYIRRQVYGQSKAL